LHGDLADNDAMPWKATDAMKERVNFVLEWERRWDWVKRHRDAGLSPNALEEKSRRPLTNPHAISAEVEDLVVQARKLMPRRGPRKLRRIQEFGLPKAMRSDNGRPPRALPLGARRTEDRPWNRHEAQASTRGGVNDIFGLPCQDVLGCSRSRLTH
jgi:hypothetical protein